MLISMTVKDSLINGTNINLKKGWKTENHILLFKNKPIAVYVNKDFAIFKLYKIFLLPDCKTAPTISLYNRLKEILPRLKVVKKQLYYEGNLVLTNEQTSYIVIL